MPFARDWNLVNITGQYLGSDGVAMIGHVIFQVDPVRLLDSAALQTIISRPLYVQLDGLGKFSVELPATDDPDITPDDFTYKVIEKFDYADEQTYHIEVPLAYAGMGLDISMAAHITPNTGIIEDVTREEFDALVATVTSLEAYDGGYSDSMYAGELDGGDAFEDV